MYILPREVLATQGFRITKAGKISIAPKWRWFVLLGRVLHWFFDRNRRDSAGVLSEIHQLTRPPAREVLTDGSVKHDENL